MNSANEKMFWLKFVAVSLLFCAPTIALGFDVLTPQTRAELSAEYGQTDVCKSPFGPAIHAEKYDSSWKVASESPVAPKNVANVVDGTASNGGIIRGGAFIDGKVYVGRGGHFDGAVSAGARNIDRATAKGISVFEKDGIVYWANDSISLPKALTQSEMATVREALQAAFPGKEIRQLVSISEALK